MFEGMDPDEMEVTIIKVIVPTNIFVRLFTWKPVEAMALRFFEEPPCGHEGCPRIGWQPVSRGWTVNGTHAKAALEIKTREQIRRSEALGG